MKHEEYDPEMGEPVFPEGFAGQGEGKTLEEQLRCFTVVERWTVEAYSYGELDGTNKHTSNKPLSGCSNEMRSVVLKDGVVVGVRISQGVLLLAGGPERCTYYAPEDDGTGNRSRTDYARLTCVVEA